MLRSVLHKFDTSASSNRYEVLLRDLLHEVVLAHDAEEAPFDLLQRLRVNAHIVVMKVELLFFRAQASFHRRILFYSKQQRLRLQMDSDSGSKYY